MDVVRTQRNMARRRTGNNSSWKRSVEFQEDQGGSSRQAVDAVIAPRAVDSLPSTANTDGDSSLAAAAAAAAATGEILSSNNEPSNDAVVLPAAAPPIKRRGPFERFRRKGHQRRRSTSAPPSVGRRYNPLLEDHFCVDAARRVVLPGVPRHDPDWARDSHDFFNLIFLLPVVALNVMNWNWDVLLHSVLLADQRSNRQQRLSIPDAWTGDWFDVFFKVTLLYFIVDLLWILAIPSSVKSPATIIQHHLATMLYIFLPYYHSEYQWCMGACMIVEINTWFLIARRVFNKQGFPPWILNLSFVSIRVKLISLFFYVTWISIRCILYPSLMPLFYQAWQSHSEKVGTPWNVVILCIPLHGFFCFLNIKWSYDLLMSKIRYWRRPKKPGSKEAYCSVSKGL